MSSELPLSHEMQPDEQLWDVALRYGLTPEVIWEHQKNEGLRQRRHRPEALAVGDALYIPAPREKTETCATGRKHTFRLRGPKLGLRIQLVMYGEVLADMPVELRPDVGKASKQVTNDQGFFEVPVELTARRALLVVEPGTERERAIALRLDGFAPWNTVLGAQQRLRNLGYVNVEPTGTLDDATVAAVFDFQGRVGLSPDGALSDEVKQKVEELYDTGLVFSQLDQPPGREENPYVDTGSSDPEDESTYADHDPEDFYLA